MEEQLVNQINAIWQAAKSDSPSKQKSAVCVSTVDSSGFPQSRFVDLKSVTVHGFVFCTAYDSEKGKNLNENPKVSLTAWWDQVGFQIRAVGQAIRISDKLADKFWNIRTREAQIATKCFKQSEAWQSSSSIENHFNKAKASNISPISRPVSWGGFTISPHSIEILEFKESRVHIRQLHVSDGQTWTMRLLQP